MYTKKYSACDLKDMPEQLCDVVSLARPTQLMEIIAQTLSCTIL
jgi:hypothetical protein